MTIIISSPHMLQLNNQDNTFSEIGRLANVEATDWSWGALLFDADNDGLKDILLQWHLQRPDRPGLLAICQQVRSL